MENRVLFEERWKNENTKKGTGTKKKETCLHEGNLFSVRNELSYVFKFDSVNFVLARVQS